MIGNEEILINRVGCLLLRNLLYAVVHLEGYAFEYLTGKMRGHSIYLGDHRVKLLYCHKVFTIHSEAGRLDSWEFQAVYRETDFCEANATHDMAASWNWSPAR